MIIQIRNFLSALSSRPAFCSAPRLYTYVLAVLGGICNMISPAPPLLTLAVSAKPFSRGFKVKARSSALGVLSCFFAAMKVLLVRGAWCRPFRMRAVYASGCVGWRRARVVCSVRGVTTETAKSLSARLYTIGSPRSSQSNGTVYCGALRTIAFVVLPIV